MTPDEGGAPLLSGHPEDDERRIQHILRTIAEVNSNRDLDSVLASVVDRTLEHTKAERAILMLVESGRLRWRMARDHKGRDLPRDTSFSKTVVKDVSRTGQPKILKNTAAEELADLGTSIINLRLLTVMCVPLRYRGRLIGVIYVDSKATTADFRPSDLVVLQILADQAAVAIENARLLKASLEKERIQQELRIAQNIQMGLLPRGPLALDGFDVFGSSVPCEETGGDYFDFIKGPDGKVRIAVGDVKGHGVPAALFMVTARALLRAFSSSEPDLASCASRINAHLARDMDPGEFMSLFLADLSGPDRTLSYVCAGHPPPILVRESGEVEDLRRTGLGLGIKADADFGIEGPIGLRPGDVLLVFTDGLTEARKAEQEGRELFDEKRLIGVLVECRSRGAREISRAIGEAVSTWRGAEPRDDDETMVVVKAL